MGDSHMVFGWFWAARAMFQAILYLNKCQKVFWAGGPAQTGPAGLGRNKSEKNSRTPGPAGWPGLPAYGFSVLRVLLSPLKPRGPGPRGPGTLEPRRPGTLSILGGSIGGPWGPGPIGPKVPSVPPRDPWIPPRDPWEPICGFPYMDKLMPNIVLAPNRISTEINSRKFYQ